MLVLKRKEGQWVDVTHRSGEVLRIRVCRIEPGLPGQLNLAFDDDDRNFEIERPERKRSRDDARSEADKGEQTVESGDGKTIGYLQGISPDRLRKQAG